MNYSRSATLTPISPATVTAKRKSTDKMRNRIIWSLTAGALLISGSTVGIYLIQRPQASQFGAVTILDNIDADVAGNGLTLLQADVSKFASRVSSGGGGTLKIVEASGGAAQVAASVDLRVERDGNAETVTAIRDRVIGERVAAAFARAAKLSLKEPGRNLMSLFQEAERLRPTPGQLYGIFYVGLGLATVNPADARIQMAGDPLQAVEALANQLPHFSGTELHVFFPAVAGTQVQLNTKTSEWRAEYWKQLALQMGMSLDGFDEQNIPADAAPGSPSAPAINNLPNPTKMPNLPKGNISIDAPVVLAGSDFNPDSPSFADPAVAKARLQSLALAWKKNKNGYLGVECTARTAKIGPDDTAMLLSQQRADQATAILRGFGVGDVRSIGIGFRNPIPNLPPTSPLQRNVTCKLLPK